MALPKLSSTLDRAFKAIDRLESLKTDSEALDAKYQHFISEMLMLRLFSIFEDAVSEIAFKILSGALYSDGKVPNLNVPRTTITNARNVYLNHGRKKPLQNLKWTKAQYIVESVRFVMDQNEPFISNAQIHGSVIEQMRKARNVIGHNSASAKDDFNKLIKSKYGANIKLSIGAYLCSTKRHPVANIVRHFSEVKIILKDISRA